MMRHFYYSIIWICILLTVTGCDFRLRGQLPIPTELSVIALVSDNPNGQLTQRVRQILLSHHIGVTSDPALAPVTLNLHHETADTRILSESASSATRQYTLTYQVDYDLQVKRHIIYGPKRLQAFQNYMVNERQVLSTPTEQQILITDLQRDLAYQLISQLGSPDVKKAINQYED